MNKSGIYKYNPETGEVEKISDHIPNICRHFDVYCPEGGYWSENLGPKPIFVESREHKRKLLAERGLKESNDKLSVKET